MNKKFKKIFILYIILTVMPLFPTENELLKYKPFLCFGASLATFYCANIFKTKTTESFLENNRIFNDERIRQGLPEPMDLRAWYDLANRIGLELFNRAQIFPDDETAQNYMRNVNNIFKYGAGCIATGILGFALLKASFEKKTAQLVN